MYENKDYPCEKEDARMPLQYMHRYRKFKESYGIACCRYNLETKHPEVLMIKKRYTYAFFDFVFSKYKKKDDNRLRKLFSQMSVYEKIDILRLDFDKLWCRIRIKIPEAPDYTKHNREKMHNIRKNDAWKTYMIKKNKFDEGFVIGDKGRRLRKLIHGTKSIDSIWEIPKGRPADNEKSINTAIREFKEETDIGINKYNFLIHIEPITESYIVNKCHYQHTYFIVVPNKFDWDPEINFSSYEQLVEIENIQWVSLNKAHYLNLKQIDPQLRIMNLLKKVITIFKNNYKYSNIVPVDSIH